MIQLLLALARAGLSPEWLVTRLGPVRPDVPLWFYGFGGLWVFGPLFVMSVWWRVLWPRVLASAERSALSPRMNSAAAVMLSTGGFAFFGVAFMLLSLFAVDLR